jgi:alanine dehydrogenase
MSEVAGRMSIQAGAHCLEKTHRGNGMLLGGVPGAEPDKVAIIGGGAGRCVDRSGRLLCDLATGHP